MSQTLAQSFIKENFITCGANNQYTHNLFQNTTHLFVGGGTFDNQINKPNDLLSPFEGQSVKLILTEKENYFANQQCLFSRKYIMARR